jgi:capsular polysaccharide biosynthesis protein
MQVNLNRRDSNLVFASKSMYRNFQHFMIDSGPALVAGLGIMRAHEPFELIAPNPLPVERKFMKMMEIPPDKKFVDIRTCTSKILFLPLHGPPLIYPPDHFDFFSNRIQMHRPPSTHVPAKKYAIFAARDIGSRNIANEQEVIAELERYVKKHLDLEFKVFKGSQYSLEEAAELFRYADLIVGVHGGAMAHMMFATKCPVIEIAGYFLANAELWKTYYQCGWLGATVKHISIKKRNGKCDMSELNLALELYRTNKRPERCMEVVDTATNSMLVLRDGPWEIDNNLDKWKQWKPAMEAGN